jgi:hypothetical protein
VLPQQFFYALQKHRERFIAYLHLILSMRSQYMHRKKFLLQKKIGNTFLRLAVLCFMIAGIYSCNSCNNNKTVKTEPVTAADTASSAKENNSFFPVTSYIKGQLLDIVQQGISPIKKVTKGNSTDSVFLKMEELQHEVAAFLTPVIDTANLVDLFKEEKFNDQTLAAFTFTYNPKTKLPDSISLRHWDVYIDPVEGKVTKVYMVKSRNDTTLQLTWLNDQWCSMRTIVHDVLTSEEKITWKY